MQLKGLISVRRMISSWAGGAKAHLRGKEFIDTDPIIKFGLGVIKRLDKNYDQDADYTDHLTSGLAVPSRSYFFYYTKNPPTLA